MPIKKPQPYTMPADEFRALRARLELSQSALADRLGIERRQVQRYEAGDATVPSVVAFALLYLVQAPRP